MASVQAVSPAVNAWSADYIEAQFQKWKQDPESVPADMRQFFRGFELAISSGQAPVSGDFKTDAGITHAFSNLKQAYREVGHKCAAIDPFGRERPSPERLMPSWHGLSEKYLDELFDPGDMPVDGPRPLRELIGILDDTYCRSVGVEFMHIQDTDERSWFFDRLERTRNFPDLSRGDRVHLLWQLHCAEMFETFLHKRYVGQKRFSLEGGESLIPLLDRFIERAAEAEVEEIVLGMPHRGRLNVLNNILGKTYEQIFTEFEASWDEDFVEGGGDVKYHLGYSGNRKLRTGKDVRVVLSSNPSHLESVDGVVEGRCRAKQRLRGDTERKRVVPVLIHGDAAFIAQGVVMECLNLSQLEGYQTGGTLHVVVNNLIGFTTGPEDARSSMYCTDIAKMIDAPVFHVNGEDPEAVIHVAELALEYRQTFKKDVVIDMLCYRKWGHNEGDDPSFTQPVMAALIKKKSSVLKTYAEKLLAEGVIEEKDVEEIRTSLDEQMEKAQSKATKEPSDPSIDPGSRRWLGFGRTYSHEPVKTGVSRDRLEEVAEAFGTWPDHFEVHRNLKKLLTKRRDMVLKDEPLDWGAAESLAYGTLLLDGIAVRLTGQDSRRGTFSHRHAVVRDVNSGEPYTQLNHMREMGDFQSEESTPGSKGSDGRTRQARFCIYDSPLSEEVVLAFEYGYSLADPNMLVIWEAQFGDFNNSAQVIIDQYIASAELKWQRWSGLTLLLPHAYEGQGPEHSSARLERFLQLCADDNMEVVYPTTPAQCFHMLRRQVGRKFRKPLVVMSPKSLLRLPEATSAVAELTEGHFEEIIDDPEYVASRRDRKKVKRIALCSGKVYYDIVRRRDELDRDDVAVVRLEQLYPLHTKLLEEVVGRYPAKAERVWVQEEPCNMGGYMHMDRSVQDLLGWAPLPYIGREASATPATGSKKQHDIEQARLLEEAVGALVAEEAVAAG